MTFDGIRLCPALFWDGWDDMWRLVSKNFLNARRIFPTKQRHVADMVETCRQDKNVKKAVVFGSSVTAACNPWSDIDIYFELDEEKPNLPTYPSHKVVWDKWTNFSVSPELLKEIEQKGVTVYER